MRELLKKIGIDISGYYSDNDNYIIDLEDSDEFNKLFSKLDNSDLLEENEDSSVVNTEVSNIMYYSNDFILNLIADYDSDSYKLVVSPKDDYEGEE